MLIPSKNAAFVHIPKCAGWSVEDFFFKLESSPRHSNRSEKDFKMVSTPDHLPNDVIHLNHALGREYPRELFSFTFVRNPWDRLASLYTWLKKNKDFESFVKNDVRMALEKSTTYDSWLYQMARPQTDYVSDGNGKIIVDFIGRFENIDSDFSRLCKELNIPYEKLGKANASKHLHYSYYYTTELIELVGELYFSDCKTFGYRFERPSIASRVIHYINSFLRSPPAQSQTHVQQ